ncbi:MAG: ribonuclease P protein component 1 [Candidatus Bathyarchaeia archaeon]|nr:ribonuclease P protein component 1 [Candidatus Bathyarchaeota archaeon]
MRNLSYILQDELIGLRVKVIKSSNPSSIGLSGKIIDETKNTFKILHNDDEKILIKRDCVFHFTLPDKTIIEVDGKVLIGRPEDRVKKIVRRRW